MSNEPTTLYYAVILPNRRLTSVRQSNSEPPTLPANWIPILKDQFEHLNNNPTVILDYSYDPEKQEVVLTPEMPDGYKKRQQEQKAKALTITKCVRVASPEDAHVVLAGNLLTLQTADFEGEYVRLTLVSAQDGVPIQTVSLSDTLEVSVNEHVHLHSFDPLVCTFYQRLD